MSDQQRTAINARPGDAAIDRAGVWCMWSCPDCKAGGGFLIPLHGAKEAEALAVEALASHACREPFAYHQRCVAVCRERGHHAFVPVEGMAMHRCDPCGLIQFDRDEP